ncbi:helix-turn-helix domain-containing protein [Ornithinibacillus caprae]|uniref:helix-turn-helix domain-containing protein n=1 Tax=Ornithinibacillus caprae TaxID=2678566 RepID=UPI0018C72533|nr:helix-turn-helix domain-containing protein [Ornithinibacillus caprae]
MYIDSLILKSGLHMQGERTLSGIFHLLKGKKSIQTIHDARLFHLENFYGIHPTLRKDSFNLTIRVLIKSNYIVLESNHKELFYVTEMGRKWLEQQEEKIPFTYYKGLTYHGVSNVFFERLLLFIQTFANSKMKNFSFIPIVDKESITQWVKYIYKKTKATEQIILSDLYHELSYVLNQFKTTEASLFVDRITSYNYYGLSIEQLTQKYDMSVEDVRLLFEAIIHRILTIVETNKNRFRILPVFLKDISTQHFITNTAKATHQLLLKQYSIEQIAEIRGLKINTIHDHLVEISLYDRFFPIRTYVDQQTESEILAAIANLNSMKLKDIKDAVSDDISYFQIRLVLSQSQIFSKMGEIK